VHAQALQRAHDRFAAEIDALNKVVAQNNVEISKVLDLSDPLSISPSPLPSQANATVNHLMLIDAARMNLSRPF